MFRYFTVFLSVFLIIVLTPAHASRIALVIGNANYSNESRLSNPINDANDMAAVLRNLGFEVILKHNANNRTMVSAIQQFGSRLSRQGSVGLFYFSGHGLQSKNRNFLIPVDANITSEADIEFESVNASRVLAQMEQANKGVNIVILDACRDNPYTTNIKSLRKGLARIVDDYTGFLIGYATAPNAASYGDGNKRNSIYTKHLLYVLREMPHLSITDLFIEVGARVMKETNRQQVPWQSVSLAQRFCFGKCSEPVHHVADNTLVPTNQVQSSKSSAIWRSNGKEYWLFVDGKQILDNGQWSGDDLLVYHTE